MTALPTATVRWMLIGALTALAAVALLAVAEAADAKKKKQSAAGLYVGNMIALATPNTPDPKVTFQLTPDGTVVNFVITNLPLTCATEDYNVNTDPNLRRQLETLAAPPMSLGAPLPRRGLPLGLRFSYEDPLPPPPPMGGPPPPPGGPPFRGIHVTGKTVAFASGQFRGYVNMAIFNTTRGAVGTEECHFYDLHEPGYVEGGGVFDWVAVKKAGKKRKK